MSSYTSFIKGTTITVDNMNNNFNYIGAGDWIPMSGATLTTDTTELLDIGSQSNRWNTAYVNNLNLDGEMSKAFNMIAEVTLNATASSIEFDGMNGDKDEIYIIMSRAVCQATTGSFRLGMTFNGDSASNYGAQRIWGRGVSISANRAENNSMLFSSSNSPTNTGIVICNTELTVYAKSGGERLALIDSADDCINSYVNLVRIAGLSWSNDTDTITTLKINAYDTNFVTNTNIQIWAKVATITSRSITITET